MGQTKVIKNKSVLKNLNSQYIWVATALDERANYYAPGKEHIIVIAELTNPLNYEQEFYDPITDKMIKHKEATDNDWRSLNEEDPPMDRELDFKYPNGTIAFNRTLNIGMMTEMLHKKILWRFAKPNFRVDHGDLKKI